MNSVLAIFLGALLLQAHNESEAYNPVCEYNEECKIIVECGKYIETVKRLYLADSIFHKKYLLGPVLRKTCGFQGKIPKICCPNEKLYGHTKNRSVSNCGNFLWNKNLPANGAPTDLHEFPWLALLQYDNGEVNCGGVLISERYVLTGAHCLQPPLRLRAVRLGEHNLGSGRDCSRSGYCNDEAMVVGLDLVIPHENYEHLRGPADLAAQLNDIALLRLDRAVTFSDYVRPACLPGPEPIIDGKYLAAGWAAMPLEKPRSQVKRMTRLSAIDKRTCERHYMRALQNDLICAMPRVNGLACVEDSGGPLMAVNKHSRITVLGIFTLLSASCRGTGPSVYTDVRHYVDWITNHMQ